MRTCPHCGLSNSDSNKWCESCGWELMVNDNAGGEPTDRPTAEEHNTTTSGFIGSMGKTHYVSGHMSSKAGDVQAHISGFGLMGNMGGTVYETATAVEENAPESGDSLGTLLGSVGDTKYRLFDSTSEKQSKHREAKLFGSVGSVEYRDARAAGFSPDGVNTTSGLMGRAGDSIFKTDYEGESKISEKQNIIESANKKSIGK